LLQNQLEMLIKIKEGIRNVQIYL
jgi:hypothetical protein